MPTYKRTHRPQHYTLIQQAYDCLYAAGTTPNQQEADDHRNRAACLLVEAGATPRKETDNVYYYALHMPYRLISVNTNSAQADCVYRFANRLARDRWVAAVPKQRKPLSAAHPQVQKATTVHRRYNMPWPIAVGN